MPTELPYAADAEVSLSYDELEVRGFRWYLGLYLVTDSSSFLAKVLRTQYSKEQAQGHVTIQTKFNYAWGLVKSPLREHQVEGVRILQGTFPVQPFIVFSAFFGMTSLLLPCL